MRDFFHARRTRRLALQTFDQPHHLRTLTLDRDFHTLAVVAHPACQSEFMRKLVHEGSETDALYLARDSDLRVDHQSFNEFQ
jgi:hypothetical protein